MSLNSSSHFQSHASRKHDFIGGTYSLQDQIEEEKAAAKRRATRIAMQEPQTRLEEFF